jgi:hypothetical protein
LTEKGILVVDAAAAATRGATINARAALLGPLSLVKKDVRETGAVALVVVVLLVDLILLLKIGSSSTVSCHCDDDITVFEIGTIDGGFVKLIVDLEFMVGNS